ncbi:metal ABC transporter ATP-binding protein [Pikeienuella sp. HZG-20]|uniref:metal ABC transporter ATP-binding protein n=1 Tax=Paludibacillus litoralis TaxID=3133267 RepID=UPI0030EB9B41
MPDGASSMIPAAEALIEAADVSVALGGRRVLDGIDFAIARGEIVTIVGPNGSGKSTFLRVLVGAARPDSGNVRRAPALRIGYAPQRLHIDPTMPITVRRFLDLPARLGDDAAAMAALAETGVAHLAGRQMAGLSGGQTQRVLLARALTATPDLLILDEPTQGLDQPGAADFYRLIESVRARTGAAVLMVSHDLHVVMSASDRVICLNGHICCEGAPSVVSSAPEYRALFGYGTGGALALYQHDHDHAHEHERPGAADAG